ncbi:MAG: response regulator transcription factor [Pleurocapsa minor GSE-CHR-MK-17-07R]|jgi:DNA-binding NarL/FixJ family response regulator|nr:response regulator transcription factor [Pleurocapsa minor GSE-CHR-MK 17-07R]
MIRVLIVDDQTVIREGLKVILNASGTIEVVGMASGADEALALAAQVRPDVVLMDLKMPVVNGIQATRLFRAQFPETPVLVLTTYDEDDWVVDAIRAGASGYMLKDSERDALVAAIEGTAAGRSHLDPAVAGKVMDALRFGAPSRPDFASQLSERELEILRLLSSGLSNAAIGDRLALAEGTVRNYVTTIFSKLDVTDRAQATALAWRYGLMREG